MSIVDNNKIDVKNKVQEGQRIIKITSDGNTMYIPVGMSGSEPCAGVDPSVITTTADQVLANAKYMTSEGELASGSIETLSVTTYTPGADGVTIPSSGKYCDKDITVEGDSNLVSGNIKKGVTIFGVSGSMESGDKFEMLGAYDSPDRYMSEKATLNGQAGNLMDFRFRDDLVKTINTVVDAENIYPAGVESIFGENNYITLSNITNIKPENLKKGVRVLDVVGTYEGESSDGGDPYIEVTGAGSPEANGKYYLDDPTTTGATRRFSTEDGISYMQFDSGDLLLISIATGQTKILYYCSPGVDASMEDICNAAWSTVMNGEEPVPTLTYHKGGSSFDFSAASVFNSASVLKDTKAYNGNGDLVTGSIDLTNLEPYSIKRGVTINGVTGKYTSVSSNAATAEDILSNKIAFVNGTKLTGKMPTSTPTMDGNTVTVPRGYVSSDQQFTVESSGGGMEFYECDSVSGGNRGDGSSLVVSGTSTGWPTGNWGANVGDADGTYNIVDSAATGKSRKWKHESKNYWITSAYDYWYIDRREYPDPTMGSPIIFLLPASPLDNPWESTSFMWENWSSSTNSVALVSIPGGSPSWSGYKMAWSEGEAGDGFTISGSDWKLNGDYIPDSAGTYYHMFNEMGRISLIYDSEAVWTDYAPCWCLLDEEVGYVAYYNDTVAEDASIAEICNSTWKVGSTGRADQIPTMTPKGSPAGWVKTDELVEGLEIKGYTPKVGNIYNSNTTIEVKRMFNGTTWDYVVYMPLEADSNEAETGQTITKIGSPVYAVSGGIECLKLNGGSGLAIPDLAVDLSGDLTICCKAKYETLQDGVLFHLGTAANRDLLVMNNYSGSSWTVGTAAGSGAFNIPSNIIENQWYDIVLVRSGGKLKLYQDGVLLGEDYWDVTINPRGTVSVGCGYYNGNYTWHFSGYMSKFMIFNRALSEEEITKVLA